jgi:hypothetical protein
MVAAATAASSVPRGRAVVVKVLLTPTIPMHLAICVATTNEPNCTKQNQTNQKCNCYDMAGLCKDNQSSTAASHQGSEDNNKLVW